MARTPKVVEDRREQILDAAIRVFAQKGFTRATNKDIAREAGITPGLIYHYFESKEAVMKAIIESRSPLGMLRSLPPETLELPPETFLPFLLKQVLGMVESGQLRRGDASLTAQVLLGSMVGFVLRRQILRAPVALLLTQEQIANAIVDNVLYGLKPR